MECFFQKGSWQQFLKIQVRSLKSKKANGPFLFTKLEKNKIMEFLFLNCSWKFTDPISYKETSLPGKFYVHQEISAPFMRENVNFAFFPWPLSGHSKKTLT